MPPSDTVLRSINRRLRRIERQGVRVRIDESGTRNLVWQGGVVPVGGTNGGSYQPHDADLDAIAALTTTAYGRALLTLADQAALVALLPSYQPHDADLDAVAALTTTTYGRAFLTLDDQDDLLALLPAYQSEDTDLTAIAALTTTAYGRAFLTLADQAALVALLPSYQPQDSDLDAIAALATTSFGRSLLTQASAAAARSTLLAARGSDEQVLLGPTGGAPAVSIQWYDDTPDYIVASHKFYAPGFDAQDQKITNVANGTATDDAAAYGQLANLVTGPASAVSDNLAGFNGTTGKVIEDSGAAAASVPSSSEKGALAGTDGTPSNTNRYVTDSDPLRRITEIPLNDAVLSLNIDGYWTLGSSGGLTDLVGDHDGTAQGGVTVGAGPSLNSESEGSTDMDGSDDYISTTWAPYANGGALTVFGWMDWDNPRTVFGGSFDVLIGSSAADGPVLGVRPNGSAQEHLAQVIWRADGQEGSPISWDVEVNRFLGTGRQFFALIFDEAANEADLWIGPGSLGVQTATAQYAGSPGNLAIGRTPAASLVHTFEGSLSHVGVALRRLTPETLRWLWRIGTGHTKDWGLVTELPPAGQSIVGDTLQFAVPPNDSGVIWNFIYDGVGDSPWKFIGGSSLCHEVGTTTPENTSGTSYGDNLTTYGPNITLPLAGDYDIELGCKAIFIYSGTGSIGWMSYSIGGATATDSDGIWAGEDAGSLASIHNTRRKTGFSADTELVAKYRVNSNAASYYGPRYIRATPVRVG